MYYLLFIAQINCQFTLSRLGMSAHEEEEHASSASEEELATAVTQAASSSQGGDAPKKKKKKKKSKASKALNAIVNKISGRDDEGANIPDELVGEVLDQVKRYNPEESKNLDSDEVRRTLAALKILDVLEGKSGLGGKNRKDMGEHKVFLAIHHRIHC